MKWFTIILIAGAMLVFRDRCTARDAVSPTNTPALIELSDQYNHPQHLSFPTTNITLLTIADRKGSEQITGWVSAVKRHFGQQIDIRGIADVSGVPGPLRGFIRKKFQKIQSYPVMMDWSGDTVKAFPCVAGEANIFVISCNGQILRRFDGEADKHSLQKLYQVVESELKPLRKREKE